MGDDFKKIKDKIKGAADTNKNPKVFVCKVLVKAFLIIAFICIAIAILDLNGINFTQCFDFDFFTGESVDSARYLLSAIAQAQAAVIALVVTLTLIAVQLASQTYSPRVMDLFKKHLFFWLLLLLYIVSILYDVIVLGTVDKEMNYLLGHRISFAILLAGLAFFALFPYTFDVINHLKPENVIRKMIEKINRKEFVDKINKTVEEKREENKEYKYDPRDLKEDDDKIIPVVDIIKRAIKEDDLTTSRVGIRELENLFEEIFSLEYSKGNEAKLVRHFCYHFEKIADRAAFREDEDSVAEVCYALEKIGKMIGNKGLDNATKHALESLGKIVLDAGERKLFYATNISVDSLGEISVVATEKELKETTIRSIMYLCTFGKMFIEKKYSLDNLIKNLSEMYEKSPKLVGSGINMCYEQLKEKISESELKSFQQFKNQLPFLNKKP